MTTVKAACQENLLACHKFFSTVTGCMSIYRVGHEKVARLPFARVLVIFSLWHL
jgi:hypothetical protein